MLMESELRAGLDRLSADHLYGLDVLTPFRVVAGI
jgi:hypothetical protein